MKSTAGFIMAGQGFKDADDQAPLYLRTTEEMLEEFSYLGQEKAYEVVVDQHQTRSPICARRSPRSARTSARRSSKIPTRPYEISATTRPMRCTATDLPKIVVDRLERELHSIISNGFAVMYIIAQKLVWKSNEDGYLVGSRGSVGSSFVATMAGITEVNPLSPHYYCPNCHYYDFDSEEVKKYAGMAGCDMPDKIMPGLRDAA